MDKAEQYSLLWDTYNFITPRLTEYEDRYEKALLEFRQYCIDMSNGEEGKDITSLRREIGEVILELETYYVKQINTVSEILYLQSKEQFTTPVENEVSPETLVELKDVTIQLLNAHRTSASEVLELLS